jgi:NADPH-dependent curcumin reductase CurA
MSGFNFADHLDIIGEATEALRAGLDDGSIKYRTKMLHGLGQAPAGLVGLYADPTPGKTVIAL